MLHINQYRQDSFLRLAFGTGSHPGTARKNNANEDSVFALQSVQRCRTDQQTFGLFMVADGMGSHVQDEMASNLALRVMSSNIVPPLLGNAELGRDALLELLVAGVQRANEAIYRHNKQEHVTTGSTLTVALVVGNIMYVANVGDSRIYLYREPQGLRQVTRDHSVVVRLDERSIITSREIYPLSKGNQMVRYLGRKSTVEVDPFTVSLRIDDKLLLCSDGLWETVRDQDIQQVMSDPEAEPLKTAEKLIKAALKGSGRDNVSVIAVFMY